MKATARPEVKRSSEPEDPPKARILFWSSWEKIAARLVPQEGQSPRPLEEKATRNSKRHSGQTMDAIQRAQRRGLKVFAETCPKYLFLTAEDLVPAPGQSSMAGAMCCCSPPPRDRAAQEAMWRGIKDGTFEVFSSDHAPYRFDETGKLARGPESSFHQIANGVPGLKVRMPLLFSEGVGS